MRRNCPFCGVDQFLSDDKLLTAGWIFVKCHQCSATSPIAGRASQTIAKLLEKPLRQVEPQVEPQSLLQPVSQAIQAAPALELPPALPPLESEPSEPEVFAVSSEPVLIEDETEWISRPSKRWNSRLAFPFALALICFATGGYLIQFAGKIRAKNALAALGWVQEQPSPKTDFVPPSAQSVTTASMNPTDPTIPTAAAPQAPEKPETPDGKMAAAPSAPSVPRVHRTADAIAAIKRDVAAETEPQVTVAAPSAVLRAGPGTHYNRVGTAKAELQLWVKGRFDDWLEVRTGSGKKTAWIRKDLVKSVQVAGAGLGESSDAK